MPLAQLPDIPDEFNDISPGFYIALMAVGFFVATFGHLIKSKTADRRRAVDDLHGDGAAAVRHRRVSR